MRPAMDSLVPRLEAWVREEVAAQRELLAALEVEHAALQRGDHRALEDALGGVRDVLARRGDRDQRRAMLLKDFQRLWGVPAESLTLGSIAARLGGSGRRLASLRTELHAAAVDAARVGQRVKTLARYHQGVVREVVEEVLSSEGRDIEAGGLLVNTEA